MQHAQTAAPEFTACLLLISFVFDPTVTFRTTSHTPTTTNHSQQHNNNSNNNPQHINLPRRFTRRSTPYDKQPTPIIITCPREPKCTPPTTQPRMLYPTTHPYPPPDCSPDDAPHTGTWYDDSLEPSRNKRPRLDHPADTLADYWETTPDTDSQTASHSTGPSSTQDHAQFRTDRPITLTADTTSNRNIAGTSTTQDHTQHTTLPEAALPFYGDFSGTWWNSQALFTSDATLQSNKHRHAWSLLAKVDFTGFAETHSTIGHTNAASLPNTSSFFWSHGPTRWQAGVGLAVKHSFLQNFNAINDSSWQEIAPGRAAKLSLRGPSGALDLYICYLMTGTQTEGEKLRIINKLRESMAPNDTARTILMGDRNFGMETEDRLCLRTMEFTGSADKPLARNFQSMLDAYQLHELEQPAFTHENSTAQSKSDTSTTTSATNSTDNSAKPHYHARSCPLTSP